MKNDIAQFAKGIVLMLCDKFVKDKKLRKRITNIVGGNMKNVEEYAQDYAKDKVNENNEKIIINLKNHGHTIEEILKITGRSRDFVEKTLAK